MSETVIHSTDCLVGMRAMEPQSAHCCVTSPPYWGLRDYGLEPTTWGDGWKGCLGAEPTPEQYTAHLVEVFAEVRRVLRDDGTLWLNLGDSYAGPKGNNRGPGAGGGKERGEQIGFDRLGNMAIPPGLKPKDLVGIPWRCAFALQADGWYLRSDIIWHKPSPMPESVKTRPTKAHEYLFLLTKQPSPRYYYDWWAIREGCVTIPVPETNKKRDKSRKDRDRAGAVWGSSSRNRRTVWTISTQGFPGAHFATYPQKLVEPCILAGTSDKGCCPECGGPWERVLEKSGRRGRDWNANNRAGGNRLVVGQSASESAPPDMITRMLGWQPGCTCEADEPVPCTVLDPFTGSGTTGVVAKLSGRNFVGFEANPKYAEMARKRIANPRPQPLMDDVEGQMRLL